MKENYPQDLKREHNDMFNTIEDQQQDARLLMNRMLNEAYSRGWNDRAAQDKKSAA